MKTIGLIGGMTWKSSLEYYRIINEKVQKELGGWHSAKILMHSVDFDEIDLEHQTDHWERSDQILIDAAQGLERSGAGLILLMCNTAHVLFDTLQHNVKIPILHIADSVAEKIKQAKIRSVGLLGTEHTMRANFYKERLETKHGLTIVVPEIEQQKIVHQEINNVCLNQESLQTKENFLVAINELVQKGAEAVILGCTELSLVLKQGDINVMLFDTTRIHAESAVEYALI